VTLLQLQVITTGSAGEPAAAKMVTVLRSLVCPHTCSPTFTSLHCLELFLWTQFSCHSRQQAMASWQAGQGCSLDGNHQQSRDFKALGGLYPDGFWQDKLKAGSGTPCDSGKDGEDCPRSACMHGGSQFYCVGFSSKTLLLKSAHTVRKLEGWVKAQRTNRDNGANQKSPSAAESTCATAVLASDDYC